MLKNKPIKLLLILAALVPLCATYLSFSNRDYFQFIYPLGKSTIILLPILWIWKNKFTWKNIIDKWGLKFQKKDIRWGILTGLAISIPIFILYSTIFYKLLDANGIISSLPPIVLQYFWVTAIFISLWNSFMEEYFWRAFLLSAMVPNFGWTKSILINGLFFGFHHYIMLNAYFHWGIALFLTFGTMAGGWIWSWMRMKGLSIWACYISHVLIDLSVMVIGYIIIF